MALFEVGGVNGGDRFNGLCSSTSRSDSRVSGLDGAGGMRVTARSLGVEHRFL